MVTQTGLPVLGIRLTFTTTSEGGRSTPLLGGSDPSSRFMYRPNWGLPGWASRQQSGAAVLGFATTDLNPGDTTLAVIVPLWAESVPEWWSIAPGDVLRMYEGPHVCGHAAVLWIDRTEAFRDADEQERLLARMSE